MDLSAFILLWVVYLQVHHFEERTRASDVTGGITWTCKHDSTKTINMVDHHATLKTSTKRWDIFIRESEIVCVDGEFGDETEFGGRVTTFRDFGDGFEAWFAAAFESVKCNPTSHIDKKSKIDTEKQFVNLMMNIVDTPPPGIPYSIMYPESVEESSWISRVQKTTTDSEEKEDTSNFHDIYIL